MDSPPFRQNISVPGVGMYSMSPSAPRAAHLSATTSGSRCVPFKATITATWSSVRQAQGGTGNLNKPHPTGINQRTSFCATWADSLPCERATPSTAMVNGIDMCPPYAPALGFAGATVALVFACIGSAYGTGKAGMSILHIGVSQPQVRARPVVRAP